MTIWKQNVINTLTPLQLERVELYAQGLTYVVLAERYGCSQESINQSLKLARCKVGAATTKELCEALGLDCIGHQPIINGGLEL